MKTHRSPLRTCCALACFAALAIAAPRPATATSDVGPQIKLKAGQSLSGRFVHEHPVEGFAQPMRTEGRYTVGPNNKIVWNIEKPMMTTTTITDAGLTQSVGGYTVLRLSPQQMPFLAQMQQKLLWAISGDWERLKPDFTITPKGSSEAWNVTIVPKENPETRKPFQKLVAHGTYAVETADITMPNGTTDHVTFSDTRIEP